MKIMATYSGLTELEGQKESVRRYTGLDGSEKITKFKYPEPFANHYLYRHDVDDHNNNRHGVPSIEGTWITHRWINRVFAFLFAVTEVNIFLVYGFFIWDAQSKLTLLEFRKSFAWALIYNNYIHEEAINRRESKRKKTMHHKLKVAPTWCKSFINGKWKKDAKKKYQQYVCRTIGCKKQIRTYCLCSVGHWICQDCFVQHCVECAR